LFSVTLVTSGDLSLQAIQHLMLEQDGTKDLR